MLKAIEHYNGSYTDFETNSIQITDASNYEIVAYEDTDFFADYAALQWFRNRQAEYLKKSAFEQIEMQSDGTFDSWYSGIKATYPKP